MNLYNIGIFNKYKVSAYPIMITQVPDSNGNWVDTPVEGEAIKGVKYNRSAAERYFSQSWQSDVSDVFVTPESGITEDDKLRIGSVTYAVDSVDNVELTGDVYLIGLKVHK